VAQRDTVLQALRDAGDRGVHSFELTSVGITRSAARVHELRARGHTITARRERLNGVAEGVRYTLQSEAVPQPAVTVDDHDQARLFAPPSVPHYLADVA